VSKVLQRQFLHIFSKCTYKQKSNFKQSTSWLSALEERRPNTFWDSLFLSLGLKRTDLKHPIVDRSCWGSHRMHKSNQTVPFHKKCCPYYQTRYLQILARCRVFPHGSIFIKHQVRLWIMWWSCPFKMVHSAYVVYSGFALELICHPELMIVFHWCGGPVWRLHDWNGSVWTSLFLTQHKSSENLWSLVVSDFHRLSWDKRLICGNIKVLHSIPLMFRDISKQFDSLCCLDVHNTMHKI